MSFLVFGCVICSLEYDFVVRVYFNLEVKLYFLEIQIVRNVDFLINLDLRGEVFIVKFVIKYRKGNIFCFLGIQLMRSFERNVNVCVCLRYF